MQTVASYYAKPIILTSGTVLKKARVVEAVFKEMEGTQAHKESESYT